jgi:hypothetical protein
MGIAAHSPRQEKRIGSSQASPHDVDAAGADHPQQPAVAISALRPPHVRGSRLLLPSGLRPRRTRRKFPPPPRALAVAHASAGTENPDSASWRMLAKMNESSGLLISGISFRGPRNALLAPV